MPATKVKAALSLGLQEEPGTTTDAVRPDRGLANSEKLLLRYLVLIFLGSAWISLHAAPTTCKEALSTTSKLFSLTFAQTKERICREIPGASERATMVLRWVTHYGQALKARDILAATKWTLALSHPWGWPLRSKRKFNPPDLLGAYLRNNSHLEYADGLILSEAFPDRADEIWLSALAAGHSLEPNNFVMVARKLSYRAYESYILKRIGENYAQIAPNLGVLSARARNSSQLSVFAKAYLKASGTNHSAAKFASLLKLARLSAHQTREWIQCWVTDHSSESKPNTIQLLQIFETLKEQVGEPSEMNSLFSELWAKDGHPRDLAGKVSALTARHAKRNYIEYHASAWPLGKVLSRLEEEFSGKHLVYAVDEVLNSARPNLEVEDLRILVNWIARAKTFKARGLRRLAFTELVIIRIASARFVAPPIVDAAEYVVVIAGRDWFAMPLLVHFASVLTKDPTKVWRYKLDLVLRVLEPGLWNLALSQLVGRHAREIDPREFGEVLENCFPENREILKLTRTYMTNTPAFESTQKSLRGFDHDSQTFTQVDLPEFAASLRKQTDPFTAHRMISSYSDYLARELQDNKSSAPSSVRGPGNPADGEILRKLAEVVNRPGESRELSALVSRLTHASAALPQLERQIDRNSLSLAGAVSIMAALREESVRLTFWRIFILGTRQPDWSGLERSALHSSLNFKVNAMNTIDRLRPYVEAAHRRGEFEFAIKGMDRDLDGVESGLDKLERAEWALTFVGNRWTATDLVRIVEHLGSTRNRAHFAARVIRRQLNLDSTHLNEFVNILDSDVLDLTFSSLVEPGQETNNLLEIKLTDRGARRRLNRWKLSFEKNKWTW